MTSPQWPQIAGELSHAAERGINVDALLTTVSAHNTADVLMNLTSAVSHAPEAQSPRVNRDQAVRLELSSARDHSLRR